MLDNSFCYIINKEDEDTTYSTITQKDLYETEENYIRLTKEKSNTILSIILDKIKGSNELLGNISNVNNGVFTGADFLDEKKKQNLI